MPNQPCAFYNPEKLKRIQFNQRPWSIVFCFRLIFITAVFFSSLIWFRFYYIGFKNVYSFFDSFGHHSDLNLLQMIILVRFCYGFYFSTSILATKKMRCVNFDATRNSSLIEDVEIKGACETNFWWNWNKWMWIQFDLVCSSLKYFIHSKMISIFLGIDLVFGNFWAFTLAQLKLSHF